MFDALDAQAQQESDVVCELCDAGIAHDDCDLAQVKARRYTPEEEREHAADYAYDRERDDELTGDQ